MWWPKKAQSLQAIAVVWGVPLLLAKAIQFTRFGMITLVRALLRAIELAFSLPLMVVRFLLDWVAFNPKLGPLRYVAWAVFAYVAFAVTLVYVIAPVRGMVGQVYESEKLHYDAERWLATAIYDGNGDFVGTFDPRLDSVRDVNWTARHIEVGDYTANPDHKSIPVRKIPVNYWQCLVYHEDRNIGTFLNPAGIDLMGVLKIPYSSIRRSISRRKLSLGVGGSTLPMQIARVIYKTPPTTSEGAFDKLRRKLSEWWFAPVIYRELTKGGDMRPLQQWAANHLWLAQRTGGTSLHGVEVASQIVFGKQANALTTAEQFVLASAVNKPIILLEGTERLNAVRLDRWRYITEVRARKCAERLISDEDRKKKILFELVSMASGPPDPQVKPRLVTALEQHAPARAPQAKANPTIRANTLLPAARFGIREEMKLRFGFNWRNYVRGVTTSLHAGENLALRDAINARLVSLDKKYAARINPDYTLDPSRVDESKKQPDIIVVAANARGDIVRYFEAGETASYFGSPVARDTTQGFYHPEHDPRMLASTGKILAAIAIANTLRDTPTTKYVDTQAPKKGLETCRHNGTQRRGRTAIVSFACSLNGPLLRRTAKVGQKRVRRLIDAFGFNMPPKDANGEDTPPSTAAVLGLISGAPRKVQHMSSVVLHALMNRGIREVRAPTLVREFDDRASKADEQGRPSDFKPIIPNAVITRAGRPLVRSLLEAPLCYEAYKTSHGTLKSLKKWCARRHKNIRLHFAKTGTQVSLDKHATVDALVTGGIQFNNGAAYSYVVVVGTGSASQPWARRLHASQVAAPLVEVLLKDLEKHAAGNPRPNLLPARRTSTRARPLAKAKTRASGERPFDAQRNELFNQN